MKIESGEKYQYTCMIFNGVEAIGNVSFLLYAIQTKKEHCNYNIDKLIDVANKVDNIISEFSNSLTYNQFTEMIDKILGFERTSTRIEVNCEISLAIHLVEQLTEK